MLTMWPKLRRHFDCVEVELSKICRKPDGTFGVWTQELAALGSAKAEPKIAAILSIVTPADDWEHWAI